MCEHFLRAHAILGIMPVQNAEQTSGIYADSDSNDPKVFLEHVTPKLSLVRWVEYQVTLQEAWHLSQNWKAPKWGAV